MKNAIRELTDEAYEIINNIRACDELTYQQRDELLRLVYQDVNDKLTLARDMFYAWTGIKINGGDMPHAE